MTECTVHQAAEAFIGHLLPVLQSIESPETQK